MTKGIEELPESSFAALAVSTSRSGDRRPNVRRRIAGSGRRHIRRDVRPATAPNGVPRQRCDRAAPPEPVCIRPLPGCQMQSPRLPLLCNHAHRALPHCRQARLHPHQPARRLAHTKFNRAYKVNPSPTGPTEVDAPMASTSRLVTRRKLLCNAALGTAARVKAIRRPARTGTESLWTLCWREMQYAGAVNLVVGPFGWIVLAIRYGPGEALLVQRGISDGAGRS